MSGVEEVNASNLLGGHKLKVLIEDTASDKPQAISLINRFSARDKALMVLGPSSSSEGVAIAPVANELQVPLLQRPPFRRRLTRAAHGSSRRRQVPRSLSATWRDTR